MTEKLQAILVATDFSDNSRQAVMRAALVAKATGAGRACLAHAIEPSLLDSLRHLLGTTAQADEAVRQKKEEALAALAAEVAELTGYRLEPLLLQGPVSQVIAEAALDQDLLVLGDRGSHPARELAVGTTAQRLLPKSPVPVLVVRNEADKPYGSVLVATDFSERSLRAARFAARVAPGANLDVVHAYQTPFETGMEYTSVSQQTIAGIREKARGECDAAMAAFLEDTGVPRKKLTSTLSLGFPPEVLVRHARHHHADLIVVGKQGRSLAQDILLGSATQHLLAEAPCDVLVVP